MQLTAAIQNFNFDHILLNAAGVMCQTKAELDTVLASNYTGAVVTKSATPALREGNPTPRYYEMAQNLGTINSMGLPNAGFDYYMDYVSQKQTDKPIFFSIAGLSKQDNLDMLRQLEASDFDGLIELNLSCPNVPGKPQTAYDFEATEAILTEVFTFFTKPLGVKLPPYFDIVHFDMIAAILNKFPLAFVNTINSIGNGLVIDPETDTVVIKPKAGFGGLGGTIVKATALAMFGLCVIACVTISKLLVLAVSQLAVMFTTMCYVGPIWLKSAHNWRLKALASLNDLKQN